MKTIKESDMDFGGFHEKDLFHIEESELFRSLGEGIKTVEFIWLGQNKNIIFLEAKSSCPDRKNMHETPEKEKSFEKYYSAIGREAFSAAKNLGNRDSGIKLRTC